MQKFLLPPCTRSSSVPRAKPPRDLASGDKMVAAAVLAPSVQAGESDTDQSYIEGSQSGEHYQRIAQEVAKILRPTIVEAVEEAVQRSLQAIQVSLEKQAQQISETETRINSLEEGVLEAHTQAAQVDRTIQSLLDKVDDLENQARRNNLRIIGLPEAYNQADIMRICTRGIPEALGLPSPTPVERAHRLGPLNTDRKTQRAAIAAYLNYADKAMILQMFRNNRTLVVEDIPLLIFADYSAELSKRRKAFTPVCSTLAEKGTKFSLLYPAKLTIMSDTGRQLTFFEPEEAEAYLQQLNLNPQTEASPLQQRTPRHRQRLDRRWLETPQRQNSTKKKKR